MEKNQLVAANLMGIFMTVAVSANFRHDNVAEQPHTHNEPASETPPGVLRIQARSSTANVAVYDMPMIQTIV